MAKPQRTKLFVDAKVQGTLLTRIVIYWVYCMLFLTVPMLIGKTYTNPDVFFFQQISQMWQQYWPIYSAAMVMLPFVLYDVLKLSNKFAGPLYRLRREMRRLADGEDVQPINFRDNDFWQDLAEPFNAIVARLKADRENETVGTNDGNRTEANHQDEGQPVGAAVD